MEIPDKKAASLIEIVYFSVYSTDCLLFLALTLNSRSSGHNSCVKINQVEFIADYICNYLSRVELIIYKSKGYKKPDNLEIYYSQNLYLNKKTSPHIRFSIFVNQKKLTLNIRVDSLKEFRGLNVNRNKYRISQSIRDWLTERRLFNGERPLIRNSHFKNLIFIKSDSNFHEIVLQIGIYCYQEGLIEDTKGLKQTFRKVMRFYSFKIDFDDSKIFEYLISNYQLPNDYRSLKFSIKPLIWNIVRQEFKNDDRYVNVSKNTVYTWLKRNQIQIPKSYDGTYDYDEVDVDRLNELKMKRQAREDAQALNERFAPVLAIKRNISKESAKRTLRRMKNKGLKPKEIEELIQKL